MSAQHASNPMLLPDGLPVPTDDGGARHLVGARVPSITLAATVGGMVDLSALRGRTVVYAYPMTGRPGVELPAGWNDIPGARGCTPQSLAFKEGEAEIAALGARVYGLSTQPPEYQKEMAGRLGLRFPVLSDTGLALAKALRLPTMVVEGTVLLRRLTLVIDGGTVEHVFYPVFPPDRAAGDVIAWLRAHPRDDRADGGPAEPSSLR